jgi:ribosomal protein L7Ae-like RNA K-turn-binding protein
MSKYADILKGQPSASASATITAAGPQGTKKQAPENDGRRPAKPIPMAIATKRQPSKSKQQSQQPPKKKPKKPKPSVQPTRNVVTPQVVLARPQNTSVPINPMDFPSLQASTVTALTPPSTKGSTWGKQATATNTALIVKTEPKEEVAGIIKGSSWGKKPPQPLPLPATMIKTEPQEEISLISKGTTWGKKAPVATVTPTQAVSRTASAHSPSGTMQLPNKTRTPAKQVAGSAKKEQTPKTPVDQRKVSKEPPPKVASLLDAFAPKQRAADDVDATMLMALQKKVGVGATITKGRQRLQPRKKRFTSLKKKILQERLNVWRSRNPAGAIADDLTTVVLRCYCCAEELQDDDEYEEIVSNLQEMASKVGECKAVHIPRDGDDTLAYVWFTKSDDAAAARAVWDGLVLGGEKLQAKVMATGGSSLDSWHAALLAPTQEDVDMMEAASSKVILENVLTQDDFDDPDCLEESLSDIRTLVEKYGRVAHLEAVGETVVVTYQGSRNVADKAVHYLQGTLLGGLVIAAKLETIESIVENATLIMKNVLTEDDFEDEDCLAESLEDIKSLVSKHVRVVEMKTDMADGGVVHVEIEANQSLGLSLAQQLDEIMIGGQKVSVSLKAGETMGDPKSVSGFVLLRNVLTEDDIDDEDCLQESKDDIASLAGRFGTLVKLEVNIQDATVKLEYAGGATVAETAAREFNEMVIGGQTVSASTFAKDGAILEQANIMVTGNSDPRVEVDDKKSAEPEPEQLYSGDKLISERFAEMKRAPKVANMGTPRKYASLVDDAEVKPLLIEMLGELMRLQKRAVEEKNAKAKRRLVMGLREVARGIRSHKVKMVVMANNLDEYGALDEKLQEILDLSSQEGVPVFYEFNKRKLGHTIGKNIKIAVVGIQSVEGTHQQFKKLTSIAGKHNLI